MGKVMHQKTTVLPGGKIEIIDIDLPVGESVEVVVSLPSVPAGEPIEVEVLNPLEGEPRSRSAQPTRRRTYRSRGEKSIRVDSSVRRRHPR